MNVTNRLKIYMEIQGPENLASFTFSSLPMCRTLKDYLPKAIILKYYGASFEFAS